MFYKLSDTKENLRSHKRSHSEDKEAFSRTIVDEDLVYTCQRAECGKKFISEHVLKYHVRNNHKEIEYKHLQNRSSKSKTSCPLCHLQFKSFYTMHSHLLDIHQEDKDLLKEGATQISPKVDCTDCKLKFVRPSILVYHKSRVHKSSRRFQCENCILSFKQNRKLGLHSLKVHKKKIEKIEGDGASECKLCYRLFESRYNMSTHQKQFHPEDIIHLNRDIQRKELIFSCSSCNNSFLSEHLLKYHTNRQHGKEFHCKLCYYDLNVKGI